MKQATPAPATPADAVRRVLTTAGIAGAAFTLSAASALPAFASHGGGSEQDQTSQSQSSKTAAEHQDADHGQGDDGKSQDDHGNSQGGSTTEGHNPPGNNGTVKIHQTTGDSSPHNQPHVTCNFYVSFFGFDKNQTLDIAFTGQAPTGKDTPIAITDASKRSLTSTTDAGGAGNDYDGDQGAFSASNLDLSALGAPAKQGYHIKLDVSTGEPGGHKYKVFWLTPCGGTSGGTSGGTTGGTTGSTPGSTETGGTTQTGGTQTGGTTPTVGGTTAGGSVAGETAGQSVTPGAAVLGESFTKVPSGGSPAAGAQVLGMSVSRGGSSGLAALPFTGAEVGAMSLLGVAAVGGGAALTVAGRRRRHATR